MTITSTFTVEIDGSALASDVVPLLTGIVVDDSQQLPDSFSLRFRDPGRIVITKTTARIGSAIKISVLTAADSAPAALITGEITAFEAEFDSTGTFTVIRGYDPAHRLFRGRRTESYVQATASDVATTIARRAGLRIGEVSATTTVHAHISQAGETDWELLDRLARESEREVAVRDGAFSFTNPVAAESGPASPTGTGPLILKLGRDLLRFRSVLSSAEQVAEVEVRGWDVATKQPLTATATPTASGVELATVTATDLAHPFGDPVHSSGEVPYRTQAEVDGAVTVLAEEIAGTFAEFEGTARGNPALRAGAAIRVDELGAPFDGQYAITRSRHSYDPVTGYTTTFVVSGRQDRSLLGLAGRRHRRTRAPVGVAIAVVDDVNDPEGQCRVRLRFPWLADDYVSDWARTVQAGAGDRRGWTVLPEIGDEVLVAFEHGDFGRPVVLGGLFNGVDLAASGPVEVIDSGSGAVNRRSMVSREGHRIDLLDGGGATGIRMATGDGSLMISADSTSTMITIQSDGTVQIKGSQGVTIDSAAAALKLTGGTISLQASNNLTIDGGAMCTVSASMVKIN